ncbi:hypothetical protein QE152_g22229 [Popillia japonica]
MIIEKWGPENQTSQMNPEAFISTLRNISKTSTIRISNGQRVMPYWWDAEIQLKRRECNKLRRFWTRKNKTQNDPLPQEKVNYKKAKKELKILILNSKRAHWKHQAVNSEKALPNKE